MRNIYFHEASYGQLKTVHDNVDKIIPGMLDIWLTWTDENGTWDVELLIESLLRHPYKPFQPR